MSDKHPLARALRKPDAERIARAFHEEYERLAPEHGYDTRTESKGTWNELPAPNKSLMIATVRRLLQLGVIFLVGCSHYAGISVAPNGVVWIVTNRGGGGAGASREGVYACMVRGIQMECTRVEPQGIP